MICVERRGGTVYITRHTFEDGDRCDSVVDPELRVRASRLRVAEPLSCLTVISCNTTPHNHDACERCAISFSP